MGTMLKTYDRIEIYKGGRWIGADLIEFVRHRSGTVFAKVYPDDTIGVDLFFFWRNL